MKPTAKQIKARDIAFQKEALKYRITLVAAEKSDNELLLEIVDLLKRLVAATGAVAGEAVMARRRRRR